MISNGIGGGSSTPTIKTDKIFREGELDRGFILRANDTVGRLLREMIRH